MIDEQSLSLCPYCYCMTKDVIVNNFFVCGKCDNIKKLFGDKKNV